MALKEITIPDLGGATEVTVIEILVKPGDTLTSETAVVTLESDKATMEVPTTEAGVVKDIKVKVGDKVASGSVLMTLASQSTDKTEETPAKVSKEMLVEKKSAEKSSIAQSTVITQPAATMSTDSEEAGDVHAGPGVRRLARELGINLTDILGTGPKQRILKEDVQDFVKRQLTQHQSRPHGVSSPTLPVIDYAKFGPIQTKALSRLKKIAGNNLLRNWMMIPHVTQFGQADITMLEEFRQSQKESLDKQHIKLTPLVFVMKAIVASLKAFPHFNASLDANGEQLIVKNYFHIGVAVDTPDGLVVPVIRDVDKRGLVELAKDLALASEKARNKQLTPMDMQGGCFSLSSLGGIGGTAFTPIINYPEVAILGVSKIAYQPVYQAGSFVPRLMLPLSLSYDHRVIDGAEGARFMVHLTHMLSDIRHLLL